MNHNQMIISQREPSSQSEQTQLIGLSESDLAVLAEPLLRRIAGGIDCPPENCGVNHNETMMSRVAVIDDIGNSDGLSQSESQTVVELTEDDLMAIIGGFGGGGGGSCLPTECGSNHN